MLRNTLAAICISLALTIVTAGAAEQRNATLYKNPQCGCCEEYANYLRQHGFTVKVQPTHNLSLIRKQAGVNLSEKLEGCHTMFVDKYVVEGHVPIATVNKLLTERPDIRGISLPGMPQGSPGMSGAKTEPFMIYEISNDAEPRVYATE